MVSLAIAAVLTLAALPAWQQHLQRGSRMQARAELVATMLALEQHALAALTFASASDNSTPAGHWPRPVPPPPATPRHWLTATSCAGVELSRCVEVRATPVSPDLRCGSLVLRSNGEWLSLPASGGEPVHLPPEC